MAAFVAELAYIFAIEGQKCESEKHSGKRRTQESDKWFDYLYLLHSTIHNAGIGLFPVRELLTRTLIGYYCGALIWCSGLKLSYDEHMVIEPPDDLTDVFFNSDAGFNQRMGGSVSWWLWCAVIIHEFSVHD